MVVEVVVHAPVLVQVVPVHVPVEAGNLSPMYEVLWPTVNGKYDNYRHSKAIEQQAQGT